MDDLETSTPDYTKQEVQSLPDKPAAKSGPSKGEKAAVSGVSKALSGVGKDSSDTKAKTQDIADKAASEPGSTGSTESPKAAPIQGATLGSFKNGGTVPKTGPYTLHKGEKVVPADKPEKAKSETKSPYRKVYEDRMKKGVTLEPKGTPRNSKYRKVYMDRMKEKEGK